MHFSKYAANLDSLVDQADFDRLDHAAYLEFPQLCPGDKFLDHER
jgi:hypothetical protein